jgi:hypothetical protein
LRKRNLAGERKDGTGFMRELERRRSTSERTSPSTIMTSVWLTRHAVRVARTFPSVAGLRGWRPPAYCPFVWQTGFVAAWFAEKQKQFKEMSTAKRSKKAITRERRGRGKQGGCHLTTPPRPRPTRYPSPSAPRYPHLHQIQHLIPYPHPHPRRLTAAAAKPPLCPQ